MDGDSTASLDPCSNALPPSQGTFFSYHFIQISLAATLNLNGASHLVPSSLLKIAILYPHPLQDEATQLSMTSLS